MSVDRDLRMAVNIKKIRANTPVKNLLGEMGRTAETAEKYNDGHRMIDTAKTSENVVLLAPPDDYDQVRRDRIRRVNDARAQRVDRTLLVKNKVKQLKDDKQLKATRNREVAQTRKLRADTVDTLGVLVQMPPQLAPTLTREQQTQFFRDALDFMRQHPEDYGRIEVAVIHYDEHSPHMQCLATTINEETLTSDCNRITGNKTKMSHRQTDLANHMIAKGWDVERGIRRVDNPEYKNFLDDMRRLDIKVNRHNDRVLMTVWKDIQAREDALKGDRAAFNAQIDQIKAEAKVDRQKAAEELKSAQKRAQEINAQSDTTEKDIKARKDELDARESALKPKEENLNELMEQAKKDKEAAEAAKQELADKIAEARALAGDMAKSYKDGLLLADDLRNGIEPKKITPAEQAHQITSTADEGRRIAREMLDMANSLDDLTPDQQGMEQ